MPENENIFADAASDITAAMPDASLNGTISDGNNSAPKDKKGRGFDAAIHMSKDGVAILNPDGSIKMKPGRKAGSSYSYVPREAPQTHAESMATGAAIAETIFIAFRAIGGEEFTPVVQNGIDERANMIGAWQKYCEAKGITEFPPGAMVCMAMLTYVAPRFTVPTVRARFAGVFVGIRTRWKNWRARRRGERINETPPKDAE